MNMISVRSAFVIAIVGSFVAGSFVASPELRAYAAATIGSAEIIDGSILSIDIKNGEVKTADLGGNAVTTAKIKDGEVTKADIGPDAVGEDELVGVTQLTFAECSKSSLSLINPGKGFTTACQVPGADAGENLIATINADTCFAVNNARASSEVGLVLISLINNCSVDANLGSNVQISIILFDID